MKRAKQDADTEEPSDSDDFETWKRKILIKARKQLSPKPA